MPGIADLLYLGQPNPQQQIAAFLSGQSPQGGPPQGAGPAGQPPSPNGPVAPNAPAPDAQPVSASPGDPPPPGSPPQPQALQSTPQMNASYQALANPPNLMSLYLQLQQRQAASDQINHGLALIAANHAGNPAMARAIMDSANAGGNAAGQVGDLMSLYNAQTQMAGQQQMLQHADEYDAKNGWPPGTARAMILAGRGSEIVQDMKPTDLQRNYDWARETYAKNHPGASPDEIEAGAQSILLGAGGGGAVGGDMRAMNLARSQWLNDAANKGRPVPGYLTDVTKWKIYSQDLGDAKTSFGGMNQALGNFIDAAGAIGADPELVNITGSPANAAKAKLAPGSTDAGKLASDINDLSGLAKAMASRQGPKGVGQNLATLGANPDAITNFGMQNYGDNVIAPRIRLALTAQANAYGAAGRLGDMPHYLDAYLDPMYRAGGDLDPGGPSKAFTVDKNKKQPDPGAMVSFTHDLEHFGPKVALKNLEDNGYDSSSLR